MSNPPIDYTSKDYTAFRTDMLNNISTRLPAWKSRSPNDFGVVLIELFSYMGDILSYYGDRVANEAFIETAVQRSSVFSIARLLDYRPTNNIAATTTLSFTTDGTSNVTLAAGTQVQTPFVLSDTSAPVIFETDAAVTVTSPATTGTITATQGRTIHDEAVGTSDGTAGQIFALAQRPVIDGSISACVNEGGGFVTWTSYEHLIDAHYYDTAYTIITDENGIVYVQFGDGVNGHIPATGSPITVTYRVGGGAVGNVAAGTLTSLVTPNALILTMTNASPATGGADAESLDSIRDNAPKSLHALSRAVTLADYATLATQVGSIAKANAVATVYTSVTLYVAPIGGGTPTSTLTTAVSNYLATRIPIGTTVTVLAPTYISINATLNVQVLSGYNRETVRSGVVKAITAVFTFDETSFAQRVTLSTLYAAINQVVGVDYATVSLLVRTTDVQSGTADIVLNANEIPQLGTLTVTATGGVVT